ncbi:hypothetical protein [Rosenbergiella epipactidis]|uniref:hypothetical protein n=1 Tax=Rosenbergiella epipactidis TaxID=1544694 RepID=UPI00240CF6B5|nr:hypothetical protein [Rosenbergiella epipactidis]
MVRAILNGRKTQTRRIISPQPELTEGSGFSWKGALFGAGSDDRETNRNFAHCRCPFGKVGDRLWVRETFRVHSLATDVATLAYKASEQQSWTQQVARVPIELCTKQVSPEAWTPSIHMPRWASRITLEITDIRVERLNDMCENDARSEGCEGGHDSIPGYHYSATPHEHFHNVWTSIYGKDSWQSNPWVWVVEFKRVCQ